MPQFAQLRRDFISYMKGNRKLKMPGNGSHCSQERSTLTRERE